MTRLRPFLGDVAIYAAGRAMNALIPFLLLPFLTRTFSQEEFGTLEILLMAALVLGAIHSSGVPGAYTFFVRSPQYAQAKSVLISTCLAWYCTWSVILFGLTWLLLPKIFGFLSARTLKNAELILCFALMISQQVLVFVTTVLRMDNRAVSVAALSTVGSLLSAAFTVVAVFWRGAMTTSYLAGFSAGTAVAAAAGIVLLKADVRFRCWNIRDLRKVLVFGLPLIPSSLLELGLTLADRVIVAAYLAPRELAVYAVAARVAGLAQLGVQSVTMALLPLLMDVLHGHQRAVAGRVFGVLWRHLAALFLFGALAGVWIAPWLIGFISPPSYAGAVVAIPYLMLAHVFQSFTYFTYLGTLKAERTSLYSVSVFVGVTLNIAASLAATPVLGLVGAAIGTMIGTIVTAVASLAFSQRVWRLDLPTGRIAAMSIVALCAAVLLVSPGGDASAVTRLAGTAAAIAMIATIAVTRDDLTLLRSMNGRGSST